MRNRDNEECNETDHPIIEALYYANICEIALSSNKRVLCIEEQRDRWNRVTLDKQEITQFIDELTVLRDQMVEN